MNTYIYLVGKADPGAAILQTIKAAGHRVGLFLDSRGSLKNPEAYDAVVKLDFQRLDEALPRLATHPLAIAGLLTNYENYVVSLAKIADYFGLPALSLQTARACTDKYTMRQAFADYDPGITPAFQVADELDEALEFAAQHGYPVMLKPRNLVKSLLVLRCANERELRINYDYAKTTISDLYKKYRVHDHPPRIIIEEFISGRQFSVAAFSDQAGQPHICEGIVALESAQDKAVDDTYLYSRILPAELDEAMREKIVATAEAGMRALAMRSSAAHVELIVTANGDVKLIEIGARLGGYRPRMYNLSYDIDLYAAQLAVATGQVPAIGAKPRAYSATFELFPTMAGDFKAITKPNAEALDESAFYYCRVTAKAGQPVGPAKHGFKAAAVIIVSHQDYDEFNRQCQLINDLQVNLL